MRTCPAQSHQSKPTPSLFCFPRAVLGIANRLYSLRRPAHEVPFTYFHEGGFAWRFRLEGRYGRRLCRPRNRRDCRLGLEPHISEPYAQNRQLLRSLHTVHVPLPVLYFGDFALIGTRALYMRFSSIAACIVCILRVLKMQYLQPACRHLKTCAHSTNPALQELS